MLKRELPARSPFKDQGALATNGRKALLCIRAASCVIALAIMAMAATGCGTKTVGPVKPTANTVTPASPETNTLENLLSRHPLNTDVNKAKYERNPVIARAAGTWESVDVGHIAALPPDQTHDGKWHAWYVGHSGGSMRIGHATSNDGLSWTRDAANPVLASARWGVNDPYVVSVIQERRLVYHMFLELYDPSTQVYSIGKSESYDGVTWTEVHEVLRAEPRLSNEIGVSVALVDRDQATGKWSMLFSGIDKIDPQWVIWTGLADSPDGESWTKRAILEQREGKFVFPHALLKRDFFLALFVLDVDEIHLGGSFDLSQWAILPGIILSKSEPYENPNAKRAGIGTDGLALAYYQGKYYVYYSYYANTAGNRDIAAAVVKESRRTP